MTMGVEAAPAERLPSALLPWWESAWCLGLIVFATALPLFYPPVPPLVDLLGHMGRYRVELDLGRSPWLQHYYDYHWAAIGNLGVDLLVIPLGKLIGLEPAVKLIVLMIPPLTAAGFFWVAREVHGRVPPTAFLALPFISGYPFMFGFVNFALSVALAFLAFGLWLRLGRLERTKLRGWLFAPISLLIFFCHTYGWGLLGLMCFSADAVRLHDRGRTWWRAGLEAAMHTSVMALPLLAMLLWRGEAHGGETVDWFNWKVKWRWIYSALRDRWKWLDIGSLVVPALVFLYAIFSRKLELSRNLAFSAIVLAAAFTFLPRIVFGSAYADMRLVPYLMAVGLLAIRFRGPPARTTAQVLAVDRAAVLRDANGRQHHQPQNGRGRSVRQAPGDRPYAARGAGDQPRRNDLPGILAAAAQRAPGGNGDRPPRRLLQRSVVARRASTCSTSNIVLPAIMPPIRRSWCARTAASTRCTA